MSIRTLQEKQQIDFRQHLIQTEKSGVTINKYIRDVRSFFIFVEEYNQRNREAREKSEITKETTIAYKTYLQEQNYAVASVNSMLASLNSFLEFIGWTELKVKGLKLQRKTYCTEEKELTKKEYIALIKASENQPQLQLIMQTICGTGIRISELKYFTVEEVLRGEVWVRCKGKNRPVLISGKLKKMLLQYCRKNRICSGNIFVTKNGNAVDRSNVWARMKKLCHKAGVAASKVFPHNLRKLFARTFYSKEKDIAKLADILGHGNIETTRIYIMSTGMEHRKVLEELGLVIEKRLCFEGFK